MKSLRPILLIISLLLISCEEVVKVDLEQSEPRLVVEASINWEKGTTGNNQKIRLTTTVPFYAEETEPVTNAAVKITSEDGREFPFVHESGGYYVTNDFRPQVGTTYKLTILYNDEVYTASETMVPVVDIDHIEQSKTGGFGGEDYEIKAFYEDPAGESNYYLFIFRTDKSTLEVYKDEFTDGNEIFGYFSNEDLEAGDEVIIEMAGISKAYYQYLFVLRTQIGNSGGGPFETQPATVKGNIVNETNKENFAFGYFRLSQKTNTKYTIE
ncbi:MAG: DUF4249 domain-containing protein [Salegentibacter sp.]